MSLHYFSLPGKFHNNYACEIFFIGHISLGIYMFIVQRIAGCLLNKIHGLVNTCVDHLVEKF